jgi:RNA polymerase sigma-70 factor, ECF subfamily
VSPRNRRSLDAQIHGESSDVDARAGLRQVQRWRAQPGRFVPAGEPPARLTRVHHVGVTVAADFEACFRREYPRLVALGVAMSGRPEVARELAQETMLRAHSRWNEVSTFEQPGAWLRRVMSNLLIDHHRRVRAEFAATERLRDAAVDTAALPETGDEWDRLVSGLPARQRLIVTLYYADDRSVDEIASMLGVASGTVKSAFGKARARLLAQLSKEVDHGTN